MIKIGIVSGAVCADADHSHCSHQARREDMRLGVQRMNLMIGLDEMTLLCQLPLRP